MGWTLGGRREIKHLPQHLLEGEVVRLLAQGVYDHHQGIVALTDTRLLFVFQGLFSEAQEEFPLGAITSLQTTSRLGTGELRVTAAGRRSTISGLIKHDFIPLVARLREGLSLVQASATTVLGVVPPPVLLPDPYEALVKLAQLRDGGVISDAEFTGKKREILSRM